MADEAEYGSRLIEQPMTGGAYDSARKKNSTGGTGGTGAGAGTAAAAPAARGQQLQKGRLLTQHTGLPPRVTGAAKPPSARKPR